MRTRLEPAKQCQVRFNLDFSAPWPVNSFYCLRINFSMQLQFSFLYIIFDYAVTVSIFPNYLFMQLQFFLPELILPKNSVEGYAGLSGSAQSPWLLCIYGLLDQRGTSEKLQVKIW